MFSSLQAARVCRGRLWSRCWVWMSWKLLNLSWMQPTERMDCEIPQACCLPVCVSYVWWGGGESSGAMLSLVGPAEHSNLCDYCCAPQLLILWRLLLCTQLLILWRLLLCYQYTATIVVLPIHRKTVLLCFILTGWVLFGLVTFVRSGYGLFWAGLDLGLSRIIWTDVL